MRVAVVGHVEWIRFARVEHVPASGRDRPLDRRLGAGRRRGRCRRDPARAARRRGDALHGARRRRARPALARGARGARRAVRVRRRPAAAALGVHAHRRGGERTITTVGPKLRPRGDDDRLPWPELAEMDAVLFIAGDVEALRLARRAPVLRPRRASSRRCARGAVELDALIGSGEDEAERYHPGDLDPEPHLVVTTSGALGGWMQPGGPYTAAPLPGPREDAYGCGDSFMARAHVRARRGRSSRTTQLPSPRAAGRRR